MNIVMLTNTYFPHVGGVARSVQAFSDEFRRRGHRVLVVAPEFDNQPADEVNVLRIPAIQHFNGSDFSAVLPVSGLLSDQLDAFQPDIIHAHHPYLLGMTALRIARYRELPLVFTHHTLYEQYTHYIPLDSPVFRRFVIEMASCYANLCDQVFAPSQSIATLLQQRHVHVPVGVVPTGVDRNRFAEGDGPGFRTALGIPKECFVVGHLGRLAPEKNLHFLAEAVAQSFKSMVSGHFLVVGEGPSQRIIKKVFADNKLLARLHLVGILQPVELANAYHAMDVFAFASKSETQGMVLTEAMAAGVPIVGLDAPGVREVVRDRVNGRLLYGSNTAEFAEALQWLAARTATEREQLRLGALQTAEDFSLQRCADKALVSYAAQINRANGHHPPAEDSWQRVLNLLKAEWDILKGVANATGTAITEKGAWSGAKE